MLRSFSLYQFIGHYSSACFKLIPKRILTSLYFCSQDLGSLLIYLSCCDDVLYSKYLKKNKQKKTLWKHIGSIGKEMKSFSCSWDLFWGQPSVNGISAFWSWCCISSDSKLLHATKLSLLHHFRVFSPTGSPVCLVMFLSLIMRVQFNKLLALFYQSNCSVNSQQVYLTCRIWKDKYIKHQNLNKYCLEGLTSGYPWERGSRKIALPTFLLLLVIEHWNNCWVLFEKWLKIFFLRCKQLHGPRCINNHTSTLYRLESCDCFCCFFFQSNIMCN